MADDDGQNENDTKAFQLPPDDPNLFAVHVEPGTGVSNEELEEQFLRRLAASKPELMPIEELPYDKIPGLNKFAHADTTHYFKTLAAFMAAQTRFLRLVNTPNHEEYDKALGDYSMAQGSMIGACQQLLHDLGVI